MFGGKTPYGYTNELWELAAISQNKFAWQQVEYKGEKKNTPSPRIGAVAWEHGKKLWHFLVQDDLQGVI